MDRNNNKKQYLERREILPIFSFLSCPLRYNKEICAQVFETLPNVYSWRQFSSSAKPL